jgi:O-antigen/teichoic acid export membrane protein
MRAKASFLSDALRLLGGRFSSSVFLFATSLLVARALGPDGRGVVTAILVVPQLVQTLAELGIRQATNQMLNSGAIADREIVGAVACLFIISSILGASITFGLLLSTEAPGIGSVERLLAAILVPLYVIHSYGQGILAGKQLMGSFANVQWIPNALTFVSTGLLCGVFNLGVRGALLGLVIGYIPTSLVLPVLIRRIAPIRPRFIASVCIEIIRRGIEYACALFLITLQYRVGVIVLKEYSTSVEIGMFSVGTTVAEAIWQLPAAIGLAVFSRSAAARSEDSFPLKVARLFRVMIVLGTGMGLALHALAPLVIPALFGSEFAASVPVVRMMLPGIVAMISFKVLNMDLAGRGRPWLALIAVVPGTVANAILGLLLVEPLGAFGAAIASSAAFILTGALIVTVYLRASAIRLGQLFSFQWADFSFLRGLVGGLARIGLGRRAPPTARQKTTAGN